MAYAKRSYSEIAVETTLNGGINDSVATFVIAASTGWPTGSGGNFYALIESETIDCISRSGTTITATGGRGALGTTAAAHLSGVAVTLVYTSGDADEANYTASETVGKITGAGQILIGDGTNSLAALDVKTSGRIIVGNGTTAASVAVSGDATLSSAGALTIANDAITAAKIAANAVDSSEIAANAVGSSELADDAVDTAAIVNLAVTTGKINDAAVTAAKLAAAVAGDGLAGGAGTALSVNVDGSTIETSSDALRVKDAGIVAAKIATDAVITAKIQDSAVTSAKIANGTIVAADIADGTITSAKASASDTVPQTKQTRVTMTADRSWTSTTPAAIPTNTCRVTITKRRADTNLLCHISLSRVGSLLAPSLVSVYARVNSVNNELVRRAQLTTSAGAVISGSVLVTGLAAQAWDVDIYGSVDTDAAILLDTSAVELTVTETL